MKKFSDMKIGTRLGVGFGALLLLVALMVGVSVSMLSRLNAQADAVANVNIPRLVKANAATARADKIAVWLRNLLLNDDLASQMNALRNLTQTRAGSLDEIDALAKILVRPEVAVRVREEAAEYDRGVASVVSLQGSGRHADAVQALNKDLLPVFLRYRATLEDIKQFQLARTNSATAEIAAVYRDARMILLAVGALALVVGIGFGWFIARSITRPLADAVQIAGAVASGDLAQCIDVRSRDETGQLPGSVYIWNAHANARNRSQGKEERRLAEPNAPQEIPLGDKRRSTPPCGRFRAFP